MIKALSEFKGIRGIEVGAKILSLVMELFSDPANVALKEEKNPYKMFFGFAQNSPQIMNRIFAALSEQDEQEYTCDASEAMVNIMQLTQDPLFVSFFVSRSQKGDASSSGSVSENTKE